MHPSEKFEDLVTLVQILRKECPWDRKQTHQSIKDHLVEEVYEALEALENDDFEEFKKELGDLLLHVVFHSVMAKEQEHFSIDEVIYSLMEKLIRRHPHVFSNVQVQDEKNVSENWEMIKKKEGKKSTLDGLPKPMPALIRAQRMQEKAANVGFDWPEWEQAWNKVNEEIEEFRETLRSGHREEQSNEFGDVLFSLVNMGRIFGLQAEDSLRKTNRKFEQRFRYIEEQASKENRPLKELSLEEMDQHWEDAKKEL
jgi:MazG family protein